MPVLGSSLTVLSTKLKQGSERTVNVVLENNAISNDINRKVSQRASHSDSIRLLIRLFYKITQ